MASGDYIRSKLHPFKSVQFVIVTVTNCNLCYCPGQKTQHPFNLHCFVYLHGLLIDSCNKKYAHNAFCQLILGHISNHRVNALNTSFLLLHIFNKSILEQHDASIKPQFVFEILCVNNLQIIIASSKRIEYDET